MKLTFKELILKAINGEIKKDTLLSSVGTNLAGIIKFQGCTLEWLIENELIDANNYYFEIVKPKKKMYVHEYYTKSHHETCRDTWRSVSTLDKEAFFKHLNNNNFVCYSTEEIEIDCD